MQKKILIIITTDFVPYGGLTSVMMNYYRAIDKSKYLIDFASTNIDIDVSLLDELHRNNSEYYCLGNRKKQLLSYIRNLKNLLRTIHYDIIHINSNSATAAIELNIAKKCKVPKRIVHNHTSECDHKFAHKLMYPFFIDSYTDAIAVSNNAGKWLFPEGKFSVLNNGIDAEKYRFNENSRFTIRNEYGIENDYIVIGHLGKIYKPKNHLFLLKVFYEYHQVVSNSVLLLVGDGDMRNEIESVVSELGLNDSVIFAGMQYDVEKFLSAMDVFVFPSIWEGMPLSVIEAQASGLQGFISDRIDSQVLITKYMKSLSIDRNTDEWVRELCSIREIDRVISSDKSISAIKAAYYDSFTNAVYLENIYDR